VTWLFAILIVLALGGIAVVAAGRGTPMTEVYDDRPDATVPADGPLAGEDLRRVRFSIALRGYRMSEVDALLDRLAAQLEQGATTQADQPSNGEGRGGDESA
jgi:DivIVA domain-containing protein